MKWSDLSMGDKQQWMQFFIRNGINRLDDMNALYDRQFGEGGDKNKPYVPSYDSETGWVPEQKIYSNRPDWQIGLTDYDWSRARSMYSDENGYLTEEGINFLKNISSKSDDMSHYAANGGSIHINPSNKGKFTASANTAGMSVQEFARHVLAHKDEYSAAQVKRANFAKNATGWKHAEGGPIVTNYGQWEYPGEVTRIPSNNITMRGVNYPVLGVSDTGDTQVMYPNADYVFDGNYVDEYPMLANGGHLFQGYGNSTLRFGAPLMNQYGLPVQQYTPYPMMPENYTYKASEALPEQVVTSKAVAPWRQGLNDYQIATIKRNPKYYQDGLVTHEGYNAARSMAAKNNTGTSTFMSDLNSVPAGIASLVNTSTDFTPIIGDAKYVARVGIDLKNQDYVNAMIGAGLLAVPNIVEKPVKFIGRTVKDFAKDAAIESLPMIQKVVQSNLPGMNAVRNRIANTLHKNISPYGYHKHRQEVANAAKDFFGLGRVEGSARAHNSNVSQSYRDFFEMDIDDVRDDIYKAYLGLSDKPTTKFWKVGDDGVWSYNPEGISATQYQKFLDDMQSKTGVSLKDVHDAKTVPTLDMIGSAGGNVSVDIEPMFVQGFHDGSKVTMNDVWDVNPFRNPNRFDMFTDRFRNKYMHKGKDAKGNDIWFWNNELPERIKSLKDFELSSLTNGRPIPTKTSMYARKLDDVERYNEIVIPVEEKVKDAAAQYESALRDNLPNEHWMWIENTKGKAGVDEENARIMSNVQEMIDEDIKNNKFKPELVRTPKSNKELLDEFGLYFRRGGKIK